MPWVKFTRDYDWHVIPRRSHVAYKKGMTLLVTTACANAAVDDGAAERCAKPKPRSKEPE